MKPILGYKLVYDVQENYVANLDLNPSLSSKTKARAARLIRKAEAVKSIDLFLLAEKCYAEEMPEKKPFLILENKCQGEIRTTKPFTFLGKKDFRFCISGTITPAFGTLDAVAWFREILKKYPESSLEIVGHCTLESLWEQLTQLDNEIPQLNLQISLSPIPHEVVFEAMDKADFALLPYQNHPAIAEKMPTKLFECAAMGTPVLISPNPIWEEFLSPFTGGHAVDFSTPSTALSQFEAALRKTFFTSTAPQSALWKTEAAQLQLAFDKLLP